MNAKKIMGAVLVALLAAALFVGAGAAAPAASLDGKTVFVNQNVSGLEGTWTSGSNIITAVESAPNYGYFTGENIVEGVYVNGTGDNAISITVKYPTAVVSAIAGTSAADAYQIIGNTYYKGNDIQSYTVDSAAEDVDIKSIFLTYPSGKSLNITDFSATYLKGNLTATGDYTISVVFDISKFVTGTLTSEVEAKPVTFKVVEADAITVSASVDQMLIGENFKLTITGQPGTQYVVEYEKGHFDFDVGQKGLIYANVTKFTTQDGFNFTMPNAGKIDVVIYSTSSADETEKVTVKQETKPSNKASVTVKLSTGSISDVKTDAASYFVGDVVKISGTTTAGDINKTLLKITGTNFISNDLVAAFDEYENIDNEFSFELDTKEILNEKTGSQGKLIDVGSYTLTLDTGSAKATVVIVLKQPFVSIIEAPEVVAQGDKAEFIINAEATEAIQWYLFGTNFFNASVEPVKTTVDDTTNQFKFTLDDKFTDNMSAGQYFMVIQHPMYDGKFNIAPNNTSGKLTGAIVLNNTGNAFITPATKETTLFNVTDRQTANAAQALCDALDTQNIDDMYVKYSFFVVGEDEAFTISEIPTTIAQGETLTISGVSTSNAGDYVTVEMISTAFAAVPKETVGSAAFIAVTTKVADDGTWEVTFDTSDLNVDEYSLKVAVNEDGESKTWKNVNINVVEGAETPDTPDTPDVPDTPDTPDTPTEPTTPGFGALAALAGLGAVAVLLLRRE